MFLLLLLPWRVGVWNSSFFEVLTRVGICVNRSSAVTAGATGVENASAAEVGGVGIGGVVGSGLLVFVRFVFARLSASPVIKLTADCATQPRGFGLVMFCLPLLRTTLSFACVKYSKSASGALHKFSSGSQELWLSGKPCVG